MFKNKVLLFHLLTAVTVIIWGTTFVSTKVLLHHGLGPIEIMFYRFILAYVCLFLFSHKRIWANNWKDEGLLILSGLTGGTFYFIYCTALRQYIRNYLEISQTFIFMVFFEWLIFAIIWKIE